MSCSFVFILWVCERLQPTVSSCLFGMSKEREQGSSVSTVTVNDDSGTAISPSISRLIKASVAESIGTLTDGITQVIEDRLGGFATRFSEENSSTVEQAVKKARRESYTCRRKGNQQQLDHAVQVLDKFDEASDALKAKSYDKVKAAFELQSVHFELDSGTEVVFKRIKVIEMADKSDFGWSTVNEYLSDELASNSDDEKRMYRAERRAERKAKGRCRRFRPTDGKESASSSSTAFSSRSGPSYTASGRPNRTVYSPSQRLGPCFKTSSFLYFTR